MNVTNHIETLKSVHADLDQGTNHRAIAIAATKIQLAIASLHTFIAEQKRAEAPTPAPEAPGKDKAKISPTRPT